MAELGNIPNLPDPVETRIDEIHLLTDNSLRVWVEFEDATKLCVEIPAESDAMARVLDVVVGAVTELLSGLGSRGLDVVGFTEVELAEAEDVDEEDDE